MLPQQPHQAMQPAMRGGGHLAAVLLSAARQLSGLNGDAAAQPAARAVGAGVRCPAHPATASGSWGLGSSRGLTSSPRRPAPDGAPAAASALPSLHGRISAAALRKIAARESNSSGHTGSGSTTVQADPAAPPAVKRKRGRPKGSKAKPAASDVPAERDALSASITSSNTPNTIAAAAAAAAADAGPEAPAPTGKTLRKRTKAASAASAAAASQPQPAAGQASEALFAAQPPATTAQQQPQQLPPPDLDACVPLNPAPWAAVKRWVVFSDLHVAPRTAAVAVEVLRRVHAEAEARDAGVLFLGECRLYGVFVSKTSLRLICIRACWTACSGWGCTEQGADAKGLVQHTSKSQKTYCDSGVVTAALQWKSVVAAVIVLALQMLHAGTAHSLAVALSQLCTETCPAVVPKRSCMQRLPLLILLKRPHDCKADQPSRGKALILQHFAA